MDRRDFILRGSAAALAVAIGRQAFGRTERRTGDLLAAVRANDIPAAEVMRLGEAGHLELGVHRNFFVCLGAAISVADSASANPGTAFGRYIEDPTLRAHVMQPTWEPESSRRLKETQGAVRYGILRLAIETGRRGGPGTVIVNPQVASALQDSGGFQAVPGTHWRGEEEEPYVFGNVAGFEIMVDPSMPWGDTRFTAVSKDFAATSGVYLDPLTKSLTDR